MFKIFLKVNVGHTMVFWNWNKFRLRIMDYTYSIYFIRKRSIKFWSILISHLLVLQSAKSEFCHRQRPYSLLTINKWILIFLRSKVPTIISFITWLRLDDPSFSSCASIRIRHVMFGLTLQSCNLSSRQLSNPPTYLLLAATAISIRTPRSLALACHWSTVLM